MDNWKIFNRFGAISGLFAAILYIVGDIIADPEPEANPFLPSEAIVRGLIEKNSGFMTGAYLILLSAFLFILFIAYLRQALSANGQKRHWSIDMAFGGGLVMVAMFLLSAHFIQSTTLVQNYAGDESAAKALLILIYNWNLLVEAPPLAAFCLGVSVAGWRMKTLPKWLIVWGGLNGVLLLLPAIPGLGIFLTLFWVGALSLRLTLKQNEISLTKSG